MYTGDDGGGGIGDDDDADDSLMKFQSGHLSRSPSAGISI